MSKKLIAVASAVAIALTALVAVPAQASGFVVSINDSSAAAALASGSAQVSTAPAIHKSPDTNVLRDGGAHNFATNTAVRVSLSGLTAGQTISVSTAGGVKVLATLTVAGAAAKSTDGATSYSITTAGATASFYVFTTSTTAGSFTVSSGANAQQYFVRSNVGRVYNIASATLPSFVAPGATARVFVDLTDVFGNKITGTNASTLTAEDNGANAAFTATASRLSMAVLGGNVLTPNFATGWSYDTARALWGSTVAAATTGGNLAIALTLDATDVVGLPEAKVTAFTTANSSNPETTIAALNAQVAALTADYNALAKRWNKKVDSKRRVFNKVPLK
jgi:hypothetical protein